MEVACTVKCTAAVKAGFVTDQNPEDEVSESPRKHIDLLASCADSSRRQQQAPILLHFHLTFSIAFRKRHPAESGSKVIWSRGFLHPINIVLNCVPSEQ